MARGSAWTGTHFTPIGESSPKMLSLSSLSPPYIPGFNPLNCLEYLLTTSTVFKDMLTLPLSSQFATDESETVALDEPSDLIAKMLHGLYAARHDPKNLPESTLELLHAHVKLHDKYDIKVTRAQAENTLHTALYKSPFAGLAYASQINDLTLGRQAIELIRFDYKFDLWMSLSDVKPSWQLALAQLLLPTHPNAQAKSTAVVQRGKVTIENKYVIDLKDVASRFNPK
jgi:hypothetical protein